MRLPYDPKPYRLMDVKGAQITFRRGEKEKKRSREEIEIVKERPQHLSMQDISMTTRKTDSDKEMERNPDLESNSHREQEEEKWSKKDSRAQETGGG